MAKETNRNVGRFGERFSIVLLFGSFWALIIGAIIGAASWLIIGSIVVYAIANISMTRIFGYKFDEPGFYIYLFAVELIQIIPYVIILVIKGLF